MGAEAHHDDDEHPGAGGEPLRLRLHDPPALSAAHATVDAVYDIEAQIAARMDADLSIYPSTAFHNFSVLADGGWRMADGGWRMADCPSHHLA